MTAPSPTPLAPIATDAVFEAVADALVTAETYAETGLRFAQVRDARGLAYAVRCAAASLEAAARLTVELRPARERGGPPA